MYDKHHSRELIRKTRAFLDEETKVSNHGDMDDLIEVLQFHEWKYYVQNAPVIADEEYDRLFDALKEYERNHPDALRPDSPTQRVSSDLSSDFPTVRHLTPMLSLANSYNADDLRDFDRQIRKWCDVGDDENVKYVVEPKFDGGSVILVYEDDLFERGATRGNGAEGDEITNNLKTLRSIPLTADFSKHGMQRAEVRGEALILKDRFREINKKREEAGLELFANPRNMATGGLRMKDPRETAQRGLDVFIYQLSYAEDENGSKITHVVDSHHDAVTLLANLGFKVAVEDIKVCNGIDDVIELCVQWEARREEYPYEIDGMVIKVDDVFMQERAGSTAHHPRWAIAYKFAAKQATTELLKVEYQVGKIGSITPVAKVRPVSLAGVTISSISLHNADFIESKDLRLGDTVLIERAGDVIPYVVKAIEEARDGSEKPIEFPKFCPVNDTDTPVRLERPEGEAAWRCPHCVCGKQDLQRMIFFVSKGAMDIDGLGKSILEKFFQLGWIRDISDIYALDYDAIAALEGFGERSAANIRAAVEASRERSLARLLYSLGIHHLGQRASKILAQHVHHILEFANWTEDDFTRLKDIGPVLARNVTRFFEQEKNVELIRRLEERGVNVRQTPADKPIEVSESSPLYGKSILFTGSLQEMTRKEAKERAARAGARNISAVSSNLDILVVGEKAGSKLKKARELGTVEILTETEFLKLVE